MPLFVANQKHLPERLRGVQQAYIRFPATVTDMDAGLLVRRVIWVDTDAGELEQFVTDDKGNFVLTNGSTEIAKRSLRGRFQVNQ